MVQVFIAATDLVIALVVPTNLLVFGFYMA